MEQIKQTTFVHLIVKYEWIVYKHSKETPYCFSKNVLVKKVMGNVKWLSKNERQNEKEIHCRNISSSSRKCQNQVCSSLDHLLHNHP